MQPKRRSAMCHWYTAGTTYFRRCDYGKESTEHQDIAIYSEDVFKLFHSVSEEQCEQQLAIVSQKWDAAFEHYYRNEIHSSIGWWVLEELHIYNPYSGVTNNQSEGLNRVIKDLQGWKEAPVDCVMLAVYQLQAFYLNEIRQGLAPWSKVALP